MYTDNIEKFAKKDYTEVVAQEKTLEMFSNLFEFEFGKIDWHDWEVWLWLARSRRRQSGWIVKKSQWTK